MVFQNPVAERVGTEVETRGWSEGNTRGSGTYNVWVSQISFHNYLNSYSDLKREAQVNIQI